MSAHLYSIQLDLFNQLSNFNDDVLDAILLGDFDGNETIEKFVNSLHDENAEMILDLLWRYLPIPLGDLVDVPAIRESVLSYLEPSNPKFRLAAAWFMRQLLRMPIVDYFHRIRTAEYQPVFKMSMDYHPIDTSLELIKK